MEREPVGEFRSRHSRHHDVRQQNIKWTFVFFGKV